MEKNRKNTLTIALALTGAAVLCFACMFMPFLFLVAPAVTAYAMLIGRRPVPAFIAVLFFGLAGSAVFYGASADVLLVSLPFLAAGCGTGLALYLAQTKRLSGFNTVLAGAAVCGGSIYLAVTLPSLLAGGKAFDFVRESVKVLTDSVSAMPELAALGLKTDALVGLADYVVESFVSCCIGIGGIVSLVNTLLFRRLVKKDFASYGLAPVNPLSQWTVPQSFLSGVCALMVASFVLLLSENDNAEAVLLAVGTILYIPVMIQGVSLIDWFILEKGTNVGKKRVIAVLAIVLLFRFVRPVLMFLGLFEQILHIRRRVRIIPRPGPGDRGNKGEP
ncbi:MAG: DUF2232 domain-containing protein [Clostridia bacterium]|nr:DUF2232 domain-containing protein [Clostridia bacterium]